LVERLDIYEGSSHRSQFLEDVRLHQLQFAADATVVRLNTATSAANCNVVSHEFNDGAESPAATNSVKQNFCASDIVIEFV